MLGGLITIIGGILAASGFIIKRSPNAQQLIDKLTPYQGWIGIVMFGWGVWETLHSVLGISLLGSHPLTWVFWLLSGIAEMLPTKVPLLDCSGACTPVNSKTVRLPPVASSSCRCGAGGGATGCGADGG